MRKLILALIIPLFSVLSVFANTDKKWGLISVSVANVRSQPAHSSEMVSQAIAGTPVEIQFIDGDWAKVLLPDDYTGYITLSSITIKSSDEMHSWRKSPRAFVLSNRETELLSDTLYAHPLNRGSIVVSDIVGGSILEIISRGTNWWKVMLPDERSGYIDSELLIDVDDWADSGTDTWLVSAIARGMTGAPYLWGGISSKGPDCSGLVKTAYFMTGIILERDASKQAETGIDIPVWRPDLWSEGDLLFFTGDNPGKIGHVAIYTNNGKFIHSSGRVMTSSIHKDDDDYLPREIVSVSRIKGAEGEHGITKVKDHPWYFNQ